MPQSILFWNIEGKRRFLDVLNVDSHNNIESDTLFSSADIVFFSETWSLLPSASLKAKDFFASEAVPTEGRPSGGLELYAKSSKASKLISKSSMHLCVELENLIVIGVYYKPSLEFDDKISDLVTALSACTSSPKPIVLGGDFNIHVNKPDFQNLSSILNNFGISLVSDPNVVTFIGSKGTSTPDHIFCSTNIAVQEVAVPSRIESPHLPLELKINTPQVSDIKRFVPQRLDIESCRKELLNLQNRINELHPEELVTQINSLFSACQFSSRKTKSDFSHQIQQLKSEVKEAFGLYQRYKSQFFKDVYLRSKKELHREIFQHKKRINEEKVANLISDTSSNGVKALYKSARPFQNSNSCQIPLRQWFEFYSNLYQTFDEPHFKEVPTVPNAEASDLLKPFSKLEILTALDHQSSKAPGIEKISPAHLKIVSEDLAPLLVPVFNYVLTTSQNFPSSWLSSMFFFLHKKGSFLDPSNYRSLAIENPFLKVFATALCFRLYNFCENNDILPEFQFGFRRNLCTTSAVTILKQAIEDSFSRKQRVYACFVDYRKAFDLTNRTKLCVKLQSHGVPTNFAKIIFNLLAGLRFHVRSNDNLSPPFESFNGVPQGDPLSPLLYTIYTGDLPQNLSHRGVTMNGNFELRYLLYADDLVLISNDPNQLQISLNNLSKYAKRNQLEVNVAKTKCIIFYKGSCPRAQFFYEENLLENVNHFTYLGVVLTTRLSARRHIEHILSKCNARIGVLFTKLPVKSIPLQVAIQLFNIYVFPIVSYALSVWLPLATASQMRPLNAVFTKFLKRYLGIPYSTNNSLVYFVTETAPLSQQLNDRCYNQFLKIRYPTSMNGVRLTPPTEDRFKYSLIEEIPSYFWLTPVLKHSDLPLNPTSRRAILYEILDLYHPHLCVEDSFHKSPTEACLCRLCEMPADRFHFRDCPATKHLSPCAKLKFFDIA